METAPVPDMKPEPVVTPQLPKATGRTALWLLIFAAWLFASFLRLYWVEEAHLQSKKPFYQRNGEILPNTHDSYFFGSIIQKAHLGMHSANKEVADPYKYGPITLLPVKILGWFNEPAVYELNNAANKMNQAAAGLKKLADSTEDNATQTILNAGVELAEKARDELSGTHPTPHEFRQSARKAAETARQIAQDLNALEEKDAPIRENFKRAEVLATAAARRPMLSVEQIMAYMPAVFGGLLAVPLVLIGRLLGSTWWGFLAALIGASAHSYFNRTMAGYFDTDMFSVTLPAVALYFFLRALCHRSLWPAVAGAVTLFIFPFFYRSGIPVAVALGIAFAGYQLVFHWREAVAWKSVVPVALAMVFLDSSWGDVMVAHPTTWTLKLGAIIGAAAVLHWVPPFQTKSSLSNWPVRAPAVMAMAAVVLFSSQLGYLRFKVYQYLPGETTAATAEAKTTQLQYKNVISTIQEARGVDKRTWAIRISGTIVGFALTVIGYGLLVARHPQCLIAMPLVGIGLFALMGGLRFTIHAVGIAALSVTWIFFAHESCRLGRTIIAGFFGGLGGAAGWLWLAWLSGNNTGSIDLLLLPTGLLAGYAALVTGIDGPGETPTHGQRAWIAMGGCGTGVLIAKAVAAGLSMGKLTDSIDIASLILALLAILIAAAIPMSRHPWLATALGSWSKALASDTRPRILATCLGVATMTGLVFGHLSHVPVENIYQTYQNELRSRNEDAKSHSLTQFQIEAVTQLQKRYGAQRNHWREQMLQGQLDAAQLGPLIQYLPRAGMALDEFAAFMKEARTNPKFKELLAKSHMANAQKDLATIASQPLGFEGLILGMIIGLAGAWAARGRKQLEAMAIVCGTTLLGLFILLTMKCGFLDLQLGGVLTAKGFLLILLTLGFSMILTGALPWPGSGVERISRATLAAAAAGGLGWQLLGSALGNPLLSLLPLLGLWAGWLVARSAPKDQQLVAPLFGGLALMGMVLVAQLMAINSTTSLMGNMANALSNNLLWLWMFAGGLLAALAAIMTKPGRRLEMPLSLAGVAGVLTACAVILLLVMGRKVMASFLPNSGGALILLNNLGLWLMGTAVGLIILRTAYDRNNPTLTWLAASITFIGVLTGMAVGNFGGFKQWAMTPGVLWLLIAGLTAGTLPVAMEKGGGHFRKMVAGLTVGTGAGVLWALLAHAAGQPMALALWPVGALAGGAVALTSENNDGWPASFIATGTALLGMAAGLTALDWQWSQFNLLIKPGALAGLVTAALLPLMCRSQWRTAAAGLLAALVGAWMVVWIALMIGEPISLLMWPLGGLVGFAVARNGGEFPLNFRPLLAAGLALVAGLTVTILTPGNDFANGGGIWPSLGVVTAGLAPLVLNEESLPGRTVIAGLTTALLGGLAWGWLAREMNATGKPGVEPLTFGPWTIGTLTGLAVAWAAQDKRGWLPPVTAAFSTLIGVITGILVMGTYGGQSPETLGRALNSWSQFNNSALMLGVLILLGITTASGMALLRERVDGSLLTGWGMATVGAVGLLVPHAMHARQQARAIEPVLFSPSVDLLEVMGKRGKPGDHMITWWDYGTAGWYHGDCNVMIHPGQQTDDIWVASRILSSTSQREAANLGRLAIEGYTQQGPLAVRHIFKDQLSSEDDNNNDGIDDWTGLPAVGEKGTQSILDTLSLPLPGTGTNQPTGPTYHPPISKDEKRDIFLYLPTRLLPIYPVIRQFSQRDLMSAEREYELGLLMQPHGSQKANDPNTTKAVMRLFGQAAEKGHAAAQINLAARHQSTYLKTLPPQVAHLPAAAREGNATALNQLQSFFSQQAEKGYGSSISAAHQWASRAVCTLQKQVRNGNGPVSGNNGFAVENPETQLEQAKALRDQIAIHLPSNTKEGQRINAALFKPRGAEHSMQLFEPTPVQPFSPGNQPPLLRLRDRYIVDTADLRLYENTDYVRYSRTPGTVALSAARFIQGMARIRRVVANLKNSNQQTNTQAIGNQVLQAISGIHPGVRLSAAQQQILVQAIEKRDTATIVNFATETARVHFKQARAWANSLPAAEQALHRNGPQFWAVQTKDGRVIAGEINKISINHVLLMDYIPVKPAGKNKSLTFNKLPVNIPWTEVTHLFRPIGWLNRTINVFLAKGNRPDGLHQLESGAVVRGRLAQSRNTGTESVHQASRLHLVISQEFGAAYLMDRDVFNSNLVQLLLLGAHEKEHFELVYFNEQGRLYRFRR